MCTESIKNPILYTDLCDAASSDFFNEIDDEIIENMDIEGCNKNK